jgi:hypothetical protein
MDKDIKASQVRSVQYWFSDGLVELGFSAICMLLAIYFLILQVLPASPGSFAIFFFLVFVAAFGIRKLIFWYRERSTYPRTGFVEPKKRQDRRLLGIEICFTVILLGFMLYTILRGTQTMAWMPAISGIVFAFIFVLMGSRTKLVRFYFLAGFCLVLGVLLAFMGLGDLWGAALLSFFTGLVLLSFGIITRATYLHQPIVSMEQADEP